MFLPRPMPEDLLFTLVLVGRDSGLYQEGKTDVFERRQGLTWEEAVALIRSNHDTERSWLAIDSRPKEKTMQFATLSIENPGVPAPQAMDLIAKIVTHRPKVELRDGGYVLDEDAQIKVPGTVEAVPTVINVTFNTTPLPENHLITAWRTAVEAMLKAAHKQTIMDADEIIRSCVGIASGDIQHIDSRLATNLGLTIGNVNTIDVKVAWNIIGEMLLRTVKYCDVREAVAKVTADLVRPQV